MEDDYCIQAPIFEDSNGTRYAVNPFAKGDRQSNTAAKIDDSVKCDSEIPVEINCEQEGNIDNKKRLHQCNYCDSTFRRADHLKRHTLNIHSNVTLESYVCPVCEKDCKTQEYLLRHIKRQHSSKKEVFHCRYCDFQCNTMNSLKKHVKVHLLTDRHACPHCSSTFKRKDHMLRHIKSLHMSMHIECHICGQKYKRKDHVARHIREKHSKELTNG